MLTAVVQPSATDAIVHLVAQDEAPVSTAEVKQGPSPIIPEVKELAWGAGSFVVWSAVAGVVDHTP